MAFLMILIVIAAVAVGVRQYKITVDAGNAHIEKMKLEAKIKEDRIKTLFRPVEYGSNSDRNMAEDVFGIKNIFEDEIKKLDVSKRFLGDASTKRHQIEADDMTRLVTRTWNGDYRGSSDRNGQKIAMVTTQSASVRPTPTNANKGAKFIFPIVYWSEKTGAIGVCVFVDNTIVIAPPDRIFEGVYKYYDPIAAAKRFDEILRECGVS